MQPESLVAAGSHGETWSDGPIGDAEGWCKIDGTGRWSGHWLFAPNCTREYGLVHIPHVAPHDICMGDSTLVVFAWMGTHCTGVVVIHITAVSMAIMPVLEALDGIGGCAATAIGS